MSAFGAAAFLPSCPLRPQSQWRANKQQPLPQLRRHAGRFQPVRRSVSLSASGGGGRNPPPVKPSFYKNPSKAIEKGGGFYIPGLRGPRLRFFVSGLTATLLTLNHLASPAASTPTLQASEAIAAATILGVLATAIADALQEAREERAFSDGASSLATPAGGANKRSTAPTAQAQTPSPQLRQPGSVAEATSAWALSVATDLTPMKAAAAFRGDALCVAAGQLADPDSGPGDIARRVADEGKVLYVADTSGLPSEVSEPVLGADACALLAVPVDDAVVMFVAAVDKGFSIEQRRWLEVLAPRVLETMSDVPGSVAA